MLLLLDAPKPPLCMATGHALRTSGPRDAAALRNMARVGEGGRGSGVAAIYAELAVLSAWPVAMHIPSSGCAQATIVHGHGPCTQDERPTRCGGSAEYGQKPGEGGRGSGVAAIYAARLLVLCRRRSRRKCSFFGNPSAIDDH